MSINKNEQGQVNIILGEGDMLINSGKLSNENPKLKFFKANDVGKVGEYVFDIELGEPEVTIEFKNKEAVKLMFDHIMKFFDYEGDYID